MKMPGHMIVVAVLWLEVRLSGGAETETERQRDRERDYASDVCEANITYPGRDKAGFLRQGQRGQLGVVLGVATELIEVQSKVKMLLTTCLFI